MKAHLIAEASILIRAPPGKVWDALVNPDVIKKYMFNTIVVSEWKQGSPIVWKGEWEGRQYEDKGTILAFEPERLMRYSHFSPLSGKPDIPQNYHTVTIALVQQGSDTLVSLTQDNNGNEEARRHSEHNWNMMLMNLKKVVERDL
ncbi:MAG TPA: SRPBCC domain-containing protein [Candidatus Thermoplasmatota archaeon]|nr:SRPBCC domain-containing protein [Candidatus Thermoplasmatota archaeon]